MEPLIKLRLLASQLQTHESHQLIQNIGFNKIISLIFDCFLLKYNKTRQHSHELSNISNMISDIIKSRNKHKSTPTYITNTIISHIDQLPFEMIGECASYLNMKDYMNFSLCNRIIYCASNTPMQLQELNIFKYDSYDMINLNRFSMIKALCIRPHIFNKLQIKTAQFPHLHRLYLVNLAEREEPVNTFCNTKVINFNQITHLSLKEFGIPQDYGFDSFCHLLIQFPNVTHLELNNIYLTPFEKDNVKIQKITPKLQALNCLDLYTNNSNSVISLRNTLLNMYCKQILYLCISFDFDISVYTFPKLNYLWTANATDNLAKVLSSTNNLKTLMLGHKSFENSEVIQNSLMKAFNNMSHMRSLSFFCVSKKEIEYITPIVEKMLLKSREIIRKLLKITISFNSEDEDDDNNKPTITEIELYITRIMNALDLSKIENVMLVFNFSKCLDTNKYRYKIIERFKLSHLAVTQDRVTGPMQYSIIISNKTCRINGYHSGKKTQLELVKFDNDNNY